MQIDSRSILVATISLPHLPSHLVVLDARPRYVTIERETEREGEGERDVERSIDI